MFSISHELFYIVFNLIIFMFIVLLLLLHLPPSISRFSSWHWLWAPRCTLWQHRSQSKPVLEQACPHSSVATFRTWLWLGSQRENRSDWKSALMAGTTWYECTKTFRITALSEGVLDDTDLTGSWGHSDIWWISHSVTGSKFSFSFRIGGFSFVWVSAASNDLVFL